MKIAVFPGDGIGPEVTQQAVNVLEALDLPGLELIYGDVGAAAYKAHGHPLPPETLGIALSSDAVLFGAVGDPACDNLERHLRPEQAILGLRSELELFANIRPACTFRGLEQLSALKPEIAREIDLVIVRELNGDVYFGDKGERVLDNGEREGWDMMAYSEGEVYRIAEVAFQTAEMRKGKLCSVDKSNVLESSRIWREAVETVAKGYPDIELTHLYVDNAAMQLVRDPGAFDVIVTGNLFGDILSDQASMCVGSIGLLASASLGVRQTQYGTFGLYEPIHGSAPDIAGRDLANPMATILSAAMLLRHSLGRQEDAERIENAVQSALSHGVRGADLGGDASTEEIGHAVISRLSGGHPFED